MCLNNLRHSVLTLQIPGLSHEKEGSDMWSPRNKSVLLSLPFPEYPTMDSLLLPFFWPRSCDPHRCAREAAGTFTCVFGSQVGKAAGEQRSRGC